MDVAAWLGARTRSRGRADGELKHWVLGWGTACEVFASQIVQRRGRLGGQALTERYRAGPPTLLFEDPRAGEWQGGRLFGPRRQTAVVQIRYGSD